MIDKLRNNPRLILLLLGVGLVLVFASSTAKNWMDKGPGEGILQKDITLKMPKANTEKLKIYTTPSFSFVYEIKDSTLYIKPLDLLVSGEDYVINVEYEDVSAQQTLFASTVFSYEEPGKISELMNSLSVPSKDFDLIVNNRHRFTAFVTTPGLEEKKIIDDAKSILESYGVDPETVELSIEYSRSANEDGIYDPFSPVL